MPEPTLNLQINDYQGQVGLFLGYGRGAANGDPAWTSYQSQVIKSIVDSGYRQFLNPPPMDGDPSNSSYDWSFLQPTITLDFPLGAQTIALPDDFGGFDGMLTVLTTTKTSEPWRIEWRNEGEIRQMYAVTPQMVGPPMFAAQQPLKGIGQQKSQKFQLFIFPASDQEYTLQCRYFVNPDAINTGAPFAYGGAQHAETVLASCLAIAEERLDDARGVRYAAWKERLAASISMDRRNKNQKLGLNRDRSDEQQWNRYNPHWWAPPATYNGQSFG